MREERKLEQTWQHSSMHFHKGRDTRRENFTGQIPHKTGGKRSTDVGFTLAGMSIASGSTRGEFNPRITVVCFHQELQLNPQLF